MNQDVRQLYDDAEVRAECLVAVLRIAVAVALGAVFVLAVLREAPAGQPMLVRQYVFAAVTLGAYMTLGILSYRANVRGRYRPWMAWLTVTGDVGFLLGNVWLSLLNTGLEADYLAGLVPVWLAPLVLAFGALRYNPWLQAYVVILVVGGLALLGVLDSSWRGRPEGAPPETLAYFFALPPNIMRLAMLAGAGMLLVVAAVRARQLLARAITEAGRRANLTRYLPPQIASLLAGGGTEDLRRGRRQKVAMLFIDMRDFTSRAEAMAPERLGAFVTDYRVCITRAVEPHGGIIDKFVGDSAMVIFGLVAPGAGDARAALAGARAALAELSAWNARLATAGEPPVAVGIGAHYGEVFCGAVGGLTRLEYTILGDAVNVAARLQEHSKAVGLPLIASEDLLKAAGEPPQAPAWQELERQPLRGRVAPIAIYGADAPVPGQT